MRILVAGATGFVGSRLMPRLVDAGHEVVVLTRDRQRAAARPWAGDVTVVEGEVTDARTVTDACYDADAVVYLVHAMEESVEDFVAAERRAATTMAQAATLAGVDHVVYLGGLADERDEDLSPHLASRIETGRILADAGVEVTEVRASIVLGAGSASYELIRFASQAPVPVLLAPAWATGRCQPIAIPDLLDVLVDVVEQGPDGRHRIVEVGGPETGAYRDLVDLMRTVRGLPVNLTGPVLAPPPVLTGTLVSQVTPIDPGTVAPLVASLAHDSVVSSRHEARVTPTAVADALARSLAEEGEFASMPGDPAWVGANLDVSLVVDVLRRLPRLPARLLPGTLTPRSLLTTAVDVAAAARRS